MSLATKNRGLLAAKSQNGFSFPVELKDRILFTIFVLIIFRFGSYVPIPGINSGVLLEISQQNSGGVLGMFNMLSGGSLGRMSIFALSIMPYITSSIIMQLLTVISKTLENLKKEGEFGRKRINQYTRYATVLLATFQGFGLAVGLEAMSGPSGSVVEIPGLFFRVSAISSLVGGTLLIMWLGEQISSRGIGNGTSLIIFSGIVAGLPSAVAALFELGRTGAFSGGFILILLILAIGITSLIVFVEKAQRRLIIQYPKRQVGNKVYGGDNTHIPLKINTAGVIPPIFASAILLFPLTIVDFTKGQDFGHVFQEIVSFLNHGKPLYMVCYVALIVAFSFFYTSIIFNPAETAENLKKYGGFIIGKKPGSETAKYFDYILTRITVIGAAYLSVICVLPEILISKYSVPFYLGGTSILIVVNVVMDTMIQVQTHLYSQQYENLMKKIKIRKS